eukprot:5210278-Amphidinium_carterae.1
MVEERGMFHKPLGSILQKEAVISRCACTLRADICSMTIQTNFERHGMVGYSVFLPISCAQSVAALAAGSLASRSKLSSGQAPRDA